MPKLRIVGHIEEASGRYYVRGFSPSRGALEITSQLHRRQLSEPVRLGSPMAPGGFASEDSYGWYDFYSDKNKIRVVTLKCCDGLWSVTVRLAPRERSQAPAVEEVLGTGLSLDEAQQLAAPGARSDNGVWAFKDCVVSVVNDGLNEQDLLARIKHRVLREKKLVARIEREVQAFENIDQAADARRERIPDSVRLFVWQRDQGRCIRCGGNQKLEFDHIIPLADGGANTERNIQLLCEACNRSKGRSL